MNLNIPILMYHQVSHKPHPNYLEYTVTTKDFAAQMKILKICGFEPITFTRLLDYKKGLTKLPAKPIIITFDDGMQDAINNTILILEDLKFTAVFYIPTDYIGRTSSWMLSEVNVEFPVIDWSTVKDLDRKGFEIGAHSMSHPHLDRISSDDCLNELSGSRQILEDTLGREVRHLAYPFGDYNEVVRKIALEVGYYTACTTEEGIAQLNDDMLLLPRLNMGARETKLNFLSKINTTNSFIGICARNLQSLRCKIPKPVKQIMKKLLHNKRPH